MDSVNGCLRLMRYINLGFLEKFNGNILFFALVWSGLFLCALLCQLVILPYVFPSFHIGHGLLVGGDTLVFHNTAEQLAEKIRQDGWSHWQLRPYGWGHVGVAVIFYYYITASPWVLIPLSSFLMALTILMIRGVISIVGFPRSISTISSFLLLLFPSTIMINMQWHKDSISVVSSVAIIFGCIYLCAHRDKLSRVVCGVCICILGLFGLYIVRDHLVLLMAFAVLSSIVFVYLMGKVYGEQDKFVSVWSVFFAIALMSAAMIVPSWTSSHQTKVNERAVQSQIQKEGGQIQEGQSQLQEGGGQLREDQQYTVTYDDSWQFSSWIPSVIDRQFAVIAEVRRSSIAATEHGCSTFGVEARINSSVDLLGFLPQALLISIFSPFPHQWFENACADGSRMLRLISGVEMMLAYLFICGVFFSFIIYKPIYRVWFVVFVCLTVLIVHGLVFVNTGTLFRVRYAWFSILISFGISSWLMLIRCGSDEFHFQKYEIISKILPGNKK